MQEFGCYALAWLVRNNPTNQAAVAASSGVECVTAAMRTHAYDERVQQMGCSMLNRLVDHQSMLNRLVVAASGAPALVASAARRFGSNAKVQKYALKVAGVLGRV